MQNMQNGVVLIKAPFGLWINLLGLGVGVSRPLTGPQCSPQPATTSMKGSRYLPCWPFFPHWQTPPQPFAGFQGLSGPLPSSQASHPLPRQDTFCFPSCQTTKTLEEFIYTSRQLMRQFNEKQPQLAGASLGLWLPFLCSNSQAFILHINFPRWIDTILLRNPFVPLAILFQSLVLLFIIIVKL